MSTEETNEKGYSRRKFLKDSAIGIAVVGGGTLLAACQTKATVTEAAVEEPIATEAIAQPTTASAATEAVATAAPATTGTDWLGTEPTIADADIAETVESDVIVLGGGTSGMEVAASLLEKGLKVVIVEKNATPSTLRNDFGSIDSKWQKEAGVKIDKPAALHYHAMYCANRIDPRLHNIWAEESGAAVTWFGELMESRGAGKFSYEGGYEPDFASYASYPKFPTGHSGLWNDGMSGAIMMQAYIEELGGEFRFETPFVKFEHDGKKVTAAIAQNKDGKYVRLVGTKGIILCTGGYQHNMDMLSALQPETVELMLNIIMGTNTGDGIKACLWMGAKFDETHTSMLFDRLGLLANETPATATKPTFFQLGSQPWLKVNLKGERFTNESLPYDFILHAAASQPGKCYCCIFDSTWFDQVQQFQTVGCSRIFPFPNGNPNDDKQTDLTTIKSNWDKTLAGLVESGHLVQADTPEALAEGLGIPADTFAATLARYNEMADAGEDTDFFKDQYRLISLKTPPYYGIRTAGVMLSTMDGIKIDTQMRPLDENFEPFEGLHVIGDSSGSYFSATYPNLFTGFAHGRTITYARRVARILAGEPVELNAAA